MRKMLLFVWAVLCAVVLGCVPLDDGFSFQVEKSNHIDLVNRRHEEMFMKGPSNITARATLRHYASSAHMAGTNDDFLMAKFTQAKMKEYGLNDSEIHTMDAYLNYPVSRSLKLFAQDGKTVAYEAPLIEDELEMDPTSHTEWRNMSFLGYGASGDAKGEVVYANYGRPEDFDVLEAAGVSVAGKIVIVRYGRCFRGLKIMNAQRRNASGVLIYSDPADDGYGQGQVYPEGPWRPQTSIQRGSVQFNSLCAGDPARASSKSSSKEICGYDVDELIPQIPALPLSYGDALPILETLGGPKAPKSFVGKLSIQYHLGPSSGPAHLVVNNTFKTTPIWNVITTIKGTLPKEEDQPIIVSNHRDAWVFGAADPNSGSTVVLEMAKGFGLLLKSGWRPKRTIIIGSWSGEEYGLVGSTGWAEEFADTVLTRAAALLNTDVGVSGRALRLQASPSLAKAFRDVTSKVNDPETGKPLSEVWDHKADTLGSGSDYTVFLDHLGVASIDTAFHPARGSSYGVYHSIYDSYTWIETQVDPFYEYHVALAKLLGLLTLKFTDSTVLPISVSDLGTALHQYTHVVQDLDTEKRLHFDWLFRASDEFKTQATRFENASHPTNVQNELLGFIERSFLDPEGLPGRKWFKHVLQSPGLYLGYDAQVFPGIQQAISDKDFDLAQRQIDRIAKLILTAANKIAKVNLDQLMLQEDTM